MPTYTLTELLTPHVEIDVSGTEQGGRNPFAYEPSVGPNDPGQRLDQLSFLSQRLLAEQQLAGLVEYFQAQLGVLGEVRDGGCDDRKARREAEEDVSCSVSECPPASVPRLPVQRDHRGCERGLCCVYSMWNDPVFIGHGKCVHRCKVSHGSLSVCGPSLLEAHLPEVYLEEPTRRDCVRNLRRAPQDNHPACRVRQVIRLRGSERGDSKSQTPISPDATRSVTRGHVVATAQPAAPVSRKRRAPTHSTSVSRIRKRMGQRGFGKVQKR